MSNKMKMENSAKNLRKTNKPLAIRLHFIRESSSGGEMYNSRK